MSKTSTEYVPFDSLPSRPLMNPQSVIEGSGWRIGLLTDSLVRFEWSQTGKFEDKPTQIILNRNFDPVPFTHTVQDGIHTIETEKLRISFDGKKYSRQGLSVFVKGVNTQFNTWRYGDTARGNLGGTARTLDNANGDLPLENGLLSADGWAIIDDSQSLELVRSDQDRLQAEKDRKPLDRNPADFNPFGTWLQPRSDCQSQDFYFFGYGHRFRQAVQDFYRLTGPVPLIPRWALGNWWSRFYRYSQEEYLQLMDRFSREGIPLSVSVIDMDWHLTDIDKKYGSGWTGYTWNRELFPDHKQFLKELHRRSLRVAVNDHPRDGIRAFEDGYRQTAEKVGIDPASGKTVEFDATSPRFMGAYFDLHHDLEHDGIDFWWLDWQQGGVTRMRGLDPLWMLNHMHFLDSSRKGKWPLTFSRYAGPGSHRYPVGFSGDTVISWKSLQFQPYFTATASNIGYGWWSHDIGGHMLGTRDEELEARWYQLGAFSPINRLHSSASRFMGKEPWNFHAPARQAMVQALRLRHRLVPYLYTMNYRSAYEGLPLVEPMYWADPDKEGSYSVRDEYYFGSQLVVSPVVNPTDPESRRAKANLWLPQGDWFDAFTGRRYSVRSEWGRSFEAWRSLEQIPVFAPAGAIIPLANLPESASNNGSDANLNTLGNPQALSLLVFPGRSGEFAMMEDSGLLGSEGKAEGLAKTVMTWSDRADSSRAVFTIHRPEGQLSSLPEQRQWTLIVRGVAPSNPEIWKDITLSCKQPGRAAANLSSSQIGISYDDDNLSLSLVLPPLPRDGEITLAVPRTAAKIADNPYQSDCFTILYDAQIPFLTKGKAMDAIDRDGAGAIPALRTLTSSRSDPSSILYSSLPQTVLAALEEVLLRS